MAYLKRLRFVYDLVLFGREFHNLAPHVVSDWSPYLVVFEWGINPALRQQCTLMSKQDSLTNSIRKQGNHIIIIMTDPRSLLRMCDSIKPGLYFECKSTPYTQTILRTLGSYSRPPMLIYAVRTQLRGDGGPAALKKTQGQGRVHLCDTGMPVRNGNPDNDRTTTTKVARVRKQLGTKNSKQE